MGRVVDEGLEHVIEHMGVEFGLAGPLASNYKCYLGQDPGAEAETGESEALQDPTHSRRASRDQDLAHDLNQDHDLVDLETE